MCTEGRSYEEYIVKGYKVDQACKDIWAEDVIQAVNGEWYRKEEIKKWQEDHHRDTYLWKLHQVFLGWSSGDGMFALREQWY